MKQQFLTGTDWDLAGTKVNTCAFESAIPMGNCCLIPLDLLRKLTTYSGTVTKYTGNVGEHLSLDSHSSLVKRVPMDSHSPTISGWACMNAEPIFTCVVSHCNVPQWKMRVKWWGPETTVLSDCLCMKLVKACNSCNCLLQKALEQCCQITRSAMIEKVTVGTAQYGSHKLHMAIDS